MSDREEALAKRVAWIMGPLSAAARALERVAAVRAAGACAEISCQGDMWFVREWLPKVDEEKGAP